MRNTYITLSNEDREYLLALTRKRTIQARIVLHAKILLYKADGLSYAAIAEKLDVNIDKEKNDILNLINNHDIKPTFIDKTYTSTIKRIFYSLT